MFLDKFFVFLDGFVDGPYHILKSRFILDGITRFV